MLAIQQPIFRTFCLLLLGAACVLGFAPFYVYPVSLISIAFFCIIFWQSNSVRSAAKDGFFYGLGLYGAGIYWIYICLHDFGGMPSWMATLATFLLCAFMGSFTGLMAAFAHWISGRQPYTSSNWLRITFAMAISWGLFDWIKSWIFTGFPWLTIGYTQVPSGPFSGFFPIIGAYGVSVLTALYASVIAIFIRDCVIRKSATPQQTKAIVTTLVVIFAMGWVVKTIEWSKPLGEPLRVDLIQGNIAQDMKWSPEIALATIQRYQNMVKASQAELIVLPETALPISNSQWAEALKRPFIDHLTQQQSHLIVGIIDDDPETRTYFNGAIGFGGEAPQYYRKSHLVPFGEFIPFKAWLYWFYRDYLNMPMSDMSRGGIDQRPMQLNGQSVAVNICYEDVFGEEIIRQLPEASLLVNITNDAWYGHSFAADQHMQFSQARALETGRMVLRATNTGATAIIDTKGHVLSHAPHFTQTTLSGTAQGHQGSTPYVRFGNWLFIGFVAFVILALFIQRKR